MTGVSTNGGGPYLQRGGMSYVEFHNHYIELNKALGTKSSTPSIASPFHRPRPSAHRRLPPGFRLGILGFRYYICITTVLHLYCKKRKPKARAYNSEDKAGRGRDPKAHMQLQGPGFTCAGFSGCHMPLPLTTSLPPPSS